MHRLVVTALFATLLLLLLVSDAAASRYMYLSDFEATIYGEHVPFYHGDTLNGCVRSNDRFYIMQDPQFLSCVISGADLIEHGTGYNPRFAETPIFNAARIEFPIHATELRSGADVTGNFFADPDRSYRASLRGSQVDVFRWFTGTLFDSTDRFDVALDGPTCMFFDAPLELEGHLTGRLTIGSSHDVLLLDNLWYDDAPLRPTGGYTPPPAASPNLLEIVSEGNVKIANTQANGRANSHARGNNQSNRDSTDIVIMASIVALGESFTFEQQNDVDSGYVYQYPDGTPHMDDRGKVWLYGSITQRRRGYLHRSTNGSTGYLKKLTYDSRLAWVSPPCDFQFYHDPLPSTDTLDFGGIPVGITTTDTAHIYTGSPCYIGAVNATTPFTAQSIPPWYTAHFLVPVSIAPSAPGIYSGLLQVSTANGVYAVVLRARALPGLAPPPHFDISPNPFNAVTTLRFTLTQPGSVKLVLYDVLGRAAKVVDVEHLDAGEHSLQINGADLASGVYFAELQTGEQRLTRKLLLLK